MGDTREDPKAGLARGGRVLREQFDIVEVLNTACHDVRAALAVTGGSANELASPEYGALTDVQSQLVAMIQRGNQRLARLASNLMQLADMWEGGGELRTTRVELGLLVRQSLEEARRLEAASKVSVEVAAMAGTVLLDVDRSRLVLSNVLGVGLGVARSRLRLSSPAEGSLVIEDDGPDRGGRGVKLEGASASKRVSSTALIFAVSAALMEAQGGSLKIESVEGPLSFRVTLRWPV